MPDDKYANLEKKIDLLTFKVDGIQEMLDADGGYNRRLIRLEDNHERAKWTIRTLGAAVLTGIVGIIFKLFSK